MYVAMDRKCKGLNVATPFLFPHHGSTTVIALAPQFFTIKTQPKNYVLIKFAVLKASSVFSISCSLEKSSYEKRFSSTKYKKRPAFI